MRPGVMGQLGPVVGTSPTDLAIARLASYAAKPARTLPDVENPRAFDPSSLEGMSMDEVKKGVPADWDVRPSRSGGGEVFEDPVHLGRRIRIMPGYAPEARPERSTTVRMPSFRRMARGQGRARRKSDAEMNDDVPWLVEEID